MGGVIEVADERLVAIRPRRFARHASRIEALTFGLWSHRRRPGNRCWLYYHQPRRYPNFLAVDYVISCRQTSLATVRGALVLLDEIARLKRSDAILCDVATTRISDRLLARWGWEPHTNDCWHRHHIRRFYGCYPPSDPLLARLLAAPSAPAEALIVETDHPLALCR